MTRLTESVPPVEVSRLVLAALVAAGAVVSVASEGKVSQFAGGFAVGAGVVFLLAFLKGRRQPGEGEPPESRGTP